MTCKSHVLLVVFALLAFTPDDVRVWPSVPDRGHVMMMAANHGATIADAATHPDGHYRCGLGPAMLFLFGAGCLGLLVLGTFVIGTNRRIARIRRTPAEPISPLVAGTVIRDVMRTHFVASVLGFVAMGLAFDLGSGACGTLLAILSYVVLSRGGTSQLALRRLKGVHRSSAAPRCCS